MPGALAAKGQTHHHFITAFASEPFSLLYNSYSLIFGTVKLRINISVVPFIAAYYILISEYFKVMLPAVCSFQTTGNILSVGQ